MRTVAGYVGLGTVIAWLLSFSIGFEILSTSIKEVLLELVPPGASQFRQEFWQLYPIIPRICLLCYPLKHSHSE
eukprot:GABW01004898.1.p1 GENE.GABW01004898.1~~GABW01004898.1.p1  ORF type:complete len:74 (-),score=5.38 GABW01004898.1:113-334(-)